MPFDSLSFDRHDDQQSNHAPTGQLDVAEDSSVVASSAAGVAANQGRGLDHRETLSRGSRGMASRADQARSTSARVDPATQSLVLLATMAILLLAARYAVPRIVEEVRYAWHRGELRAEYESGVEGMRSISLDALSDASRMVTSVVGPSVVHIDVQRRHRLSDVGETGLLSMHDQLTADQGSGVLVDDEGYLLTNRHVIADGEEITVKLGDGRRALATVIGSDPLTDLAVLKIDADQLMPIHWGDSDRCKVGSPVWAVGSPFGLDRTVTFGILSGKHRMVRASTQYQDFMQSDVAVNPGNSGGPLVDARGRLVGINTAIVGDTYQGVSFSIPSNVARQVYERIRQTGQVDRAWLGVQLADTGKEPEPAASLSANSQPLNQRGAVVVGVTSGDSPAARAGVAARDRIVSVDGEEIRDMGHLMRLIGGSLAGDSVKLGIERNGETLEILVTLGTRPEALNR